MKLQGILMLLSKLSRGTGSFQTACLVKYCIRLLVVQDAFVCTPFETSSVFYSLLLFSEHLGNRCETFGCYGASTTDTNAAFKTTEL